MDNEKTKVFLSTEMAFNEDAETGKLKGEFEGVAYSGGVIPRYGWMQNLVTDVSSLKFKSKVPVFKNHSNEKIAGNATLKKDGNKVLIKKGKLFKRSKDAIEIIELAEDGLDWELSIGLGSDYDLEFIMEGKTVEVNGLKVKGPANVIRNASIKEVSFVPVGADDKTEVKVFNDKGIEKMSTEKTEIEKAMEEISLACSCGGDAPAKVAKKAKEIVKGKEELEKENTALKAKYDELKKEMDGMKKKGKKEELKKSAENKIEFSDEKIEEILADEVKFETTMELLKAMEPKKKIDPKFAEKTEIENEDDGEISLADNQKAKIEMAAKKLMEEQGVSRAEAFTMLPDDLFEQ